MNKGIVKATQNLNVVYDESRTMFAVSEDKLDDLLKNKGGLWKDLCLISTSIFVSTTLNAASDFSSHSSFTLTLPFFLNSLFSTVTLFLAFGYGLAWRSTNLKKKQIIKDIQEGRDRKQRVNPI